MNTAGPQPNQAVRRRLCRRAEEHARKGAWRRPTRPRTGVIPAPYSRSTSTAGAAGERPRTRRTPPNDDHREPEEDAGGEVRPAARVLLLGVHAHGGQDGREDRCAEEAGQRENARPPRRTANHPSPVAAAEALRVDQQPAAVGPPRHRGLRGDEGRGQQEGAGEVRPREVARDPVRPEAGAGRARRASRRSSVGCRRRSRGGGAGRRRSCRSRRAASRAAGRSAAETSTRAPTAPWPRRPAAGPTGRGAGRGSTAASARRATAGAAQRRLRSALRRADVQREGRGGRGEQQRQHEPEETCEAGRDRRPDLAARAVDRLGQSARPLGGVAQRERQDQRVDDSGRHSRDCSAQAPARSDRDGAHHAAPRVRLAADAGRHVTSAAGHRGAAGLLRRHPERSQRVAGDERDALGRQVEQGGRGGVVDPVHPQLQRSRRRLGPGGRRRAGDGTGPSAASSSSVSIGP